MNLVVTIGDNRAQAILKTSLESLQSRTILDENDQKIVLSLVKNLFPCCDTITTRVKGLDYTVKVQ